MLARVWAFVGRTEWEVSPPIVARMSAPRSVRVTRLAKVAAGMPMDEILRVSAAPGYSEHHTGCAIDITTPGSEPLEEEFEHTDAFRWLVRSAERFGFAMSYPRDNAFGIIYEPWHWQWHAAA